MQLCALTFTLPMLLVALLSVFVRSSLGLCLPCQKSASRSTPWDVDLRLTSRTVYSPNITNPTHSTVWTKGSDVVVTWDLRDKPDKNSNRKGTLLLGYQEGNATDEHLNIDHPLAQGFNMSAGSVTFKCPEVAPRKDYIVVLFGDSGNRSPKFTIKE